MLMKQHYKENEDTLPQVIKNICAISPNIHRTILPEAFIIETIHLFKRNLSECLNQRLIHFKTIFKYEPG